MAPLPSLLTSKNAPDPLAMEKRANGSEPDSDEKSEVKSADACTYGKDVTPYLPIALANYHYVWRTGFQMGPGQKP